MADGFEGGFCVKKAYRWIISLIVLGFVLAGLFFSLAPDQIPVHYDIRGQVDRWGSKYEFIILPIINLLFGGIMVWLARREGKQGREMNENVVAGMTVCVLVFFNLLWIFFMWKAVDMENIESGLGEAYPKVFMILMFALFILLGNNMPKAQRNSIYGLRTKWSMANDTCWQKSQRFGGYALVITGIIGVLLSSLLPASWAGYSMILIITVATVTCIIGSYRIYRKEGFTDQ